MSKSYQHIKLALIFTFSIFLLAGCSEDFLYEHELIASLNEGPINIEPPCDYTSENTLVGYSNVSGKLGSPDIRESFDYTEVRCGISGTSNIVILTINSRFGLDAVESQVIDYAEKSGIVSLGFITYDFSSYSFTRTSGKLYIERLGDKKLKFTWCDVIFRERTASFDASSYGSIEFTYE